MAKLQKPVPPKAPEPAKPPAVPPPFNVKFEKEVLERLSRIEDKLDSLTTLVELIDGKIDHLTEMVEECCKKKLPTGVKIEQIGD